MYFKHLSTANLWFKYALPALIFAVLMITLYPDTHWDTRLTDVFFDAQQHLFPLKRHVFLSQWMHVGLKWLMVLIAIVCLILSIAGGRFLQIRPHRKSLLWVFVGMVVSTTVVATLKHYNQHGCPWDVTLYGGDLPLLGLFASLPAGVELGRCFPAGHPSGGFALMAFYFAFMHSKPRFSINMLWFGLAMGLIMGVVQIVRGAHFLSHVLWSGWVVWMTLLILYWVWPLDKNASH